MDSKSFVINFLTQDTFIQVNEKLLKVLKGDCTAAVMLSKLISFYRVGAYRKTLEDDWFLVNREYLENTLGLNEYNQRRAISYLETVNLLSVKYKGYPKQRFVKLDFDRIYKVIDDEVSIPVKARKDKATFYTDLNKSMAMPYIEAAGYRGNINTNLYNFMYAWSNYYSMRKKEKFVWTSEEFGKWNYYWIRKYNRKPFDYASLLEYMQGKEKADISLFEFIKSDKKFDYGINRELVTFEDINKD